LPIEGRCLLFVGKQFRKKGLPAVLVALQDLADDICLLAIVAEELVGEALELVHRHQLGARVRILGALSTMELAYCAADCLVHPTLEDTYAMVVLEAMSHGVPVIVSAAEFCGVSAELNDGENALILNDPRSRDELRTAIDRVFDDVGLRDSLSARGIEFARERQWSEVILSYEDVFRESVAAR
jgi:UDP-glucose:(heptosyl)LPS alpha-1,3-glucosyltransferase